MEGFLECGINAKEIGVISVYRSQIKAIGELLYSRPSVEMHTADKLQEVDVFVGKRHGRAVLARDSRKVGLRAVVAATEALC